MNTTLGMPKFTRMPYFLYRPVFI